MIGIGMGITMGDGLMATPESGIAFESKSATITPSVTLASGSVSWLVVESDGAMFTYDTPSFTHTKTAVGNVGFYLYGSLSQIVDMNIRANGLVGTFTANDLLKLPSLIDFSLAINSGLVCTFAISDLPATMETLDASYTASTITGGFPDLPVGMKRLTLHSTSSIITGELSGLPPAMDRLYLSGTLSVVTGGATPIQAAGLTVAQLPSTSMTQSNVDDVLLRIWTDRAVFNSATHVIGVGGTNPAPTGIYQAANPPTAGKEYAYDLVNDSNGELFNKWTVTFTA